MHVIVIGGGIVGVTSAYFLRQAGCEVTLVERNSGVAQETSFANAGIIAPGYATPWAAPGMPAKVLRTLLHRDSPVIFKPSANKTLWRWLLRWYRECDIERYRKNKLRMQRIARYSQKVLHSLRSELDIQYEQSTGYIQLLRSQKEMDLTAPARQLLAESGIQYQLMDAAQTRAFEPAISDQMSFTGALHLPSDESGNCALFAKVLRKHAEDNGVTFLFDHSVLAVSPSNPGIDVVTSKRTLHADATLIAAGVSSDALLRQLGIHIPLWPVKGFSATVPILAGEAAPRGALMDEAFKVAITRLGTRLRIAGTAEISNQQIALNEAALNTLIRVARDWFPLAANYANAKYWCGMRPMLPDGPPLLGATPKPSVFINVGHGSTGWAMSCGSARVVADVIVGRTPEIDMEGLTLARYQQR
jgi:D-amino-acid dehydrogenase